MTARHIPGLFCRNSRLKEVPTDIARHKGIHIETCTVRVIAVRVIAVGVVAVTAASPATHVFRNCEGQHECGCSRVDKPCACLLALDAGGRTP